MATAATLGAATPKFAKRKTPKAGARRDVADRADLEGDTGDQPGDVTRQLHIKATLAKLCNERIRESVSARETSGIEEEWREADDLYNGYDDLNAPVRGMRIPDKTASATRDNKATGAKSTLVVNITRPKTTVAVSRVKEMLVPTNDKPWDVKPTPVPELDEVRTNPELAGTNVQLGDGTMAPALAVAEKMLEQAKAASEDEAKWIEDRFVEGKVYAEFRKVIEEAGRLGTGVLKGPFPVCRTTRRWQVDPQTRVAALTISEVTEPTSKKVRVQDCFPDPACGDNIHNGSYFNERDYSTARELRRLAKDPSYDAGAIADALLEGPISYAMMDASGTKSRSRAGDTVKDAALYELWYCYGDCTPEALIAMGVKDTLLGNAEQVDVAADAANDPNVMQGPGRQMVNGAMPDDVGEDAFDPEGAKQRLTAAQQAALAEIPSIVTMLNGRPIKAVIAPDESGAFPFDFYRWRKKDGQPWGEGVPIEVRAAQLIVKSGVRRLMENGGLSAGPQVAYTQGALVPQNGRYEVTGKKLWKFIPNDLVQDINKAMAFFTVPSVQKELLEIIRLGLEFADILSNIPLLLHGDEAAGAAPETLGGLKMFENNAMSPLRDKAKDYDDDLIIPHLGRYHDWWMAHSDAENKGDSEVQALGSTALIQREEGRQFLMSLFPVKSDPDLRLNPAKYAKEVARAHGYDMSLIQYTDDEWKAVVAEKNKQPPPVAPQVQATQIRVDGQQKIEELHAQLAREELAAKERMDQDDQQTKQMIASVDKDIAEMELSGKTHQSLLDIKAMLAAKAADIRSRRDEMQLKLSPENPSHLGI